jgi:hypothetical protein
MKRESTVMLVTVVLCFASATPSPGSQPGESKPNLQSIESKLNDLANQVAELQQYLEKVQIGMDENGTEAETSLIRRRRLLNELNDAKRAYHDFKASTPLMYRVDEDSAEVLLARRFKVHMEMISIVSELADVSKERVQLDAHLEAGDTDQSLLMLVQWLVRNGDLEKVHELGRIKAGSGDAFLDVYRQSLIGEEARLKKAVQHHRDLLQQLPRAQEGNMEYYEARAREFRHLIERKKQLLENAK